MGKAYIQNERRAFRILTFKSTGRTLVGRPRHRFEDNIRMDLKVIGVYVRSCRDVTQDGNYWRAL